MPLHKGQIRYLRKTTAKKAKVNILVPSNRWGKSTLTACLQIWYLFYKFGIPPGNSATWFKAEYRTANVAPQAPLVEPVFKYIDQILTSRFSIYTKDGRIVNNKCLIEWFYRKEKTQNSPPMKQFFANNSYIEHRTIGGSAADALEGKPFGLITYDEGGRSQHLQEEVDGTFLARLFDWGGPLHIPSTPDQTSPSILFHYELYQKGLNDVPGYFTMEGQLKDNDFFPDEQIQEQYDLYENNPLKDQVLYGKFVFGGDNIYDAQSILDAEDESLNDGVRYKEGHHYAIGIDTAIGSDEMVYTVLDITEKPFKLVRSIAAKGNSKSPQMHLNDFLDLFDSYNRNNNLEILLETWNGESVRFYHDLPPHVQNVTKCYGSWQPGSLRTENKNKPRPKNLPVKKADIILALRKLLSARELKIPASNSALIQQLSIYKEDDGNIPTDRVFSLALASWLAETSTLQTEVKWLSW